MSDETIPKDVIDRQVEVITALQGRVLRNAEEDHFGAGDELTNVSEALGHAVLALATLHPPQYGPTREEIEALFADTEAETTREPA